MLNREKDEYGATTSPRKPPNVPGQGVMPGAQALVRRQASGGRNAGPGQPPPQKKPVFVQNGQQAPTGPRRGTRNGESNPIRLNLSLIHI